MRCEWTVYGVDCTAEVADGEPWGPLERALADFRLAAFPSWLVPAIVNAGITPPGAPEEPVDCRTVGGEPVRLAVTIGMAERGGRGVTEVRVRWTAHGCTFEASVSNPADEVRQLAGSIASVLTFVTELEELPAPPDNGEPKMGRLRTRWSGDDSWTRVAARFEAT